MLKVWAIKMNKTMYWSGFSRETTSKFLIYYKELVHAIAEAEKSHNLPSATWRLWKASDIVESKSDSLRTRGADGVIPSLRAED